LEYWRMLFMVQLVIPTKSTLLFVFDFSEVNRNKKKEI
jgi:hypothetical protein